MMLSPFQVVPMVYRHAELGDSNDVLFHNVFPIVVAKIEYSPNEIVWSIHSAMMFYRICHASD